MRPRMVLSQGGGRGVPYGPEEACVIRTNQAGRGRAPIRVTVRLDVEAMDEQIQREAEHADDDQRGEGW